MFKYFNYEDFDSPDIQGSGQMMDRKVIEMLDEAREIYGSPIFITSGYRTEAHNSKVGGVSKSSHLKGLAADISDNRDGSKMNSRNRFFMLEALYAVGFNRIGVGNGFIHVDIDTDKPEDVVWTY